MSPELRQDIAEMFYRQRQRVTKRLGAMERRITHARLKAREQTDAQTETRGLVCGYVGRRVRTGD